MLHHCVSGIELPSHWIIRSVKHTVDNVLRDFPDNTLHLPVGQTFHANFGRIKSEYQVVVDIGIEFEVCDFVVDV
jgi:hypothetical protein